MTDPAIPRTEHTCHHPFCDSPVPPKMLACRAHWYSLPARLRAAIWREYSPRQEVTKTPTVAYLEVMHECLDWWRANA